VRLLATSLLFVTAAVAADSAHDFEMKVRPLLAKQCWNCHRQSAMGGLRLDSREAMLKGGKSGTALVPGKAADSLLIAAVTHSHDRLKMPPSGKLSEAEIATLRSWIDAGANWPETAKVQDSGAKITPEQRAFWSFQPVKPPAPGSSIDGFVRARLEREGLKQVRRADKRTLIRRATIDLIGLPPTKDEVDAFLKDDSTDAFAKVVDRLLASPQYGERWARYWLDVARYADDSFNSTMEAPYPNSWRYRNWVIKAFNDDMPYNLFVNAQIAGDTMPEPEKYVAGLGFYALSPEMQDDRVDATTRGFLGLTVACAQCHDHKFDPIPTQDYYSLQGVFASSQPHEWPLASKDVVEAWKSHKKRIDDQQAVIDRFYERQREDLAEILAAQTSRYMLAAAKSGPADGLDEETLKRWTKYLSTPEQRHLYLKAWFAAATDEERQKAAKEFEEMVVAVNREKRRVDERNTIILGLDPDRGRVAGATLESLSRDKYILWRDMFERSTKDSAGFFKSEDGVFFYGKANLERWMQAHWKSYLAEQKAELERLKKSLPDQYPFLQTIRDRDKPADVKIQIRGDRNNLGEIAPRRFVAILSPEERKLWTKGSGRAELAESIADPKNPLTARVMVNRIWQAHFGRGLVNTPSNFGQLGERPTHPELLDYLAWRFVESGWSMKKLHREILLSDTWALSTDTLEGNEAKDAANVLLWRANRRRLDVEALRDSMLAVSGLLDRTPGERAERFDDKNVRRTVYGFVSRRKLDGTLALFDFPNPNSTAESRLTTNVPLQRLFFMNSPFVEQQAAALAARFTGEPDARIRGMYAALFTREPDAAELKLGLDYTAKGDWTSYARVLLTSNEFTFLE
jgi:hypothetical protein